MENLHRKIDGWCEELRNLSLVVDEHARVKGALWVHPRALDGAVLVFRLP